ncbi:hypothetical protein PMIT1313_01769 [Prochlorococcus marinus str. MIT 1313]|uniref:cofactor assembly of complex C subunit B n=1 Tax=Prochlorococcus TaxID=1218 RepID=UPI0007B38DEA|nr:cofactor assembly of complex C subunit B [Prochlorococcus marinus]KZR69308.1 hypothetical protein PMIT1313_01769 [Prochlorococcus marinus str. MIT 1313]
MRPVALISLIAGLLTLSLAVFNALTVDLITPSFQRAEVLAGVAAVGLMLMAVLWTQASPMAPSKQILEGNQRFELVDGLNDGLQKELAWGSHLLLTATPAAVILVYWNNQVLLRRGISGNGKFVPGEICRQARDRGELISLVNTSLFPGRIEFNPIVENLPAVMVYPLASNGWVVLGGCSERCFSRSDELWLIGWSQRLRTELEERT